MTSAADFRLRAARERRGLDAAATAQLADLPLARYLALEADEEDLWTAVDLRALLALGRILGVAPLDLLEGASDAGEARALTALAIQLRARLAQRHEPAHRFAAALGWPADAVLTDPSRIWQWTAAELAECAEAAGLEWRCYLGHQVPRPPAPRR